MRCERIKDKSRKKTDCLGGDKINNKHFNLLDEKEVKERITDAGGGKYKLVSDYKGANKHVTLHHKDCGKHYTTTFNHFIYDGRRCSCELKAQKEKAFEKDFDRLLGNSYEQLTPFTRTIDKIEVKHYGCGKIYETTPKSIRRGTRCSYCYGNRRKTTKQFEGEVLKNSQGEHELVKGETYKNNSTPVKIKHLNNCGHIYEVTPKDFFKR